MISVSKNCFAVASVSRFLLHFIFLEAYDASTTKFTGRKCMSHFVEGSFDCGSFEGYILKSRKKVGMFGGLILTNL